MSGAIKVVGPFGHEYVVCPVALFRPCVFDQGNGPTLYPKDEIARSAEAWRNVPLILNHPCNFLGNTFDNMVENNLDILQRQGLGLLKNVRMAGCRLKGQAWFHIGKTAKVDSRIISRLLRGEAIGVSAGFKSTTMKVAPEKHFGGKRFEYIARDYVPDHLAVLLDQLGALTIADGIGVLC